MRLSPDIGRMTEQRLADALARRRRDLLVRERTGHIGFALVFVVAAGLLAALAPAERELDPGLVLAFVLAYALLSVAEFPSGAGVVVPTQLVLVPMLLLAPTPLVPLLVAAAGALVTGVAVVRGKLPAGRVLIEPGNASFALAPALVLVAFDAQTPDWADWWVYVLALLAQLGFDALVSAARARAILGLRPREMVADMSFTYLVDALLAPLGLLAAFGAAGQPYAILLVLPLGALFLVFAREREDRVRGMLELDHAYRGTALLLRDVVEESDEYTGRHTGEVVGLSLLIAEELGVDERTQRCTELGALLHDVGKLVIPPEIIAKPGPLDEREWRIMQTHTVEGQRMLDRVGGLLGEIGVIVRASHERWDGSGYPDGLRGTEIPLAARIVTACDAYNAMTTDRPYRPARPPAVALEEVRAMAGSQFDPDVSRALVAVVQRELAPV